MNQWLQALGVSEFWINVVDIISTSITLFVALVLLVRGSIKSFSLLKSKLREMKCFKHKVKALNCFFKWFVKSAQDGTISDAEINAINKELDTIINSFSVHEDAEDSHNSN